MVTHLWFLGLIHVALYCKSHWRVEKEKESIWKSLRLGSEEDNMPASCMPINGTELCAN